MVDRKTFGAGREWAYQLGELAAEARALGDGPRARELDRLRAETEAELRHEREVAGVRMLIRRRVA